MNFNGSSLNLFLSYCYDYSRHGLSFTLIKGEHLDFFVIIHQAGGKTTTKEKKLKLWTKCKSLRSVFIKLRKKNEHFALDTTVKLNLY